MRPFSDRRRVRRDTGTARSAKDAVVRGAALGVAGRNRLQVRHRARGGASLSRCLSPMVPRTGAPCATSPIRRYSTREDDTNVFGRLELARRDRGQARRRLCSGGRRTAKPRSVRRSTSYFADPLSAGREHGHRPDRTDCHRRPSPTPPPSARPARARRRWGPGYAGRTHRRTRRSRRTAPARTTRRHSSRSDPS
jgi:hypothetical protein